MVRLVVGGVGYGCRVGSVGMAVGGCGLWLSCRERGYGCRGLWVIWLVVGGWVWLL
ncbi:hypothetical protein [Bartonella grahamii]|uniref:hypothetical protein n=1 Tax=Bartonella grahamii TaxID=33045 RepID=UPI002E7BB944|nr:hypothetical protein [Bartonella grahamii]